MSKSDFARLNKAKAAMKRAEYAPHDSRGLTRRSNRTVVSIASLPGASHGCTAVSLAVLDRYA